MTKPIRALTIALVIAPALTACGGTAAGQAPSTPAPAATRAVTQVVTHVVTRDAKLIGSAVGGVRVTIADAATGRVLAQGLHEGSTGDTRRIVTEPRRRGESIFATEGAARWTASLALGAPMLVDITAEGPLAYPDQMARASKRVLLVPGRHVEGDGIVLEMHGYIIDLLAPDSAAAPRAGAPLPLRARVRLLCSCPTQPGGLWEVEEVAARLWRGGVAVGEARLAYAGAESTYAGELAAPTAGDYELELVAASPGTATFGRVTRAVRIAP